jgi:hypothetical protein
MPELPQILRAHGLSAVYGTDSQRECSFVELRRESDGTVEVLAEVTSRTRIYKCGDAHAIRPPHSVCRWE